jgi:hypothetical protein
MKTKRNATSKKPDFSDDGVLRSPDRRRAKVKAAPGSVARKRPADPPRGRKAKADKAGRPAARSRAPKREPRGLGTPPGHGPATTPVRTPAPAKNTGQAKARAKARKAKAPKAVRVPLKQRLITRLETIDLRPRALAARVPFVVLVIGALGVGLGVTLWLSTDAAERSYRLGAAHQTNQALLQQKEALERDVLEAQAAPALAEAARGLGMIPSRDTAHLVQDPAGNWMVVGTPKPAEGTPPPPLNSPLPENTPAPLPRAVTAPGDPANPERSVRITPLTAPGAPAPAGPEVPVAVPAPDAAAQHAPAGPAAEPPAGALGAVTGPLPGPVTGPAPGPAADPALLPPAAPLATDPAQLPPPSAPPAADPALVPAPAPGAPA